MRIPVYTSQFARDVKRARRRGKNLEKFRLVVQTLLAGRPLDAIHRDHRLGHSNAKRLRKGGAGADPGLSAAGYFRRALKPA
jgi:mRNA-degrading endonuclease YafQ of YafQ-DinJ toxin-antitoxin module